jgi:hypothetical protein
MESEHDDEGWNQIRSGIALIDWSRLARFDKTQLTFEASGENEFEHSPAGHRDVHPEFGRLICWISFSVGAEYLAKGVCLLKGNLKTSKGKFGALRFDSIDALEKSDLKIVSAAMKLLGKTIRNRDVHRYERDVRAGHFLAVPNDFVPAFNSLLACLDKDKLRSTLRDIDLREQTPKVVASEF